jgi:uncharacterized protein YybS (DUF2232 family)
MSVNTGLRDWIICTAAGCLLFVLGTIMPMLSIPFMVMYSAPALFLSHERGVIQSLSSGLAVSLILTLLLSPMFAATCFFPFWVPGTLVGLIAHRTKVYGELLVLGVAATLALKIATALLAWSLTGLNFLAPDAAELERFIMSLGESGFSSLSAGDSLQFREVMRDTINYAVLLMPYAMILVSAAEIVVSCSIASHICVRRGGGAFFSLPPFGSWSFPRSILFAFAVGFICGLVPDEDPYLFNPYFNILRQVGANLNALTRTLFIIQGLSVSCFVLEQRGVPRFLRIVLIALTPLISMLGHICMIIGIFDIGFDLRKRVRGKPQ